MGILKKTILSFVFMVSGALVPLLYVWLTEGSALKVREISISSTGHMRSDELKLYLREFMGQPLYGVDLKKVQAMAGKHPWVASVSVRRQPPSKLEVQVTEREPVALMKKEHLWVLDAQGVAFKKAESESELSLPLVGSAQDVELVETYAQAKKPGGAMLEIRQHGVNQHRVLLMGGLEVIIGHKNSLKQWQKLNRIIESLKDRGNDLAFVYLDDTSRANQIAVRFKKG